MQQKIGAPQNVPQNILKDKRSKKSILELYVDVEFSASSRKKKVIFLWSIFFHGI